MMINPKDGKKPRKKSWIDYLTNKEKQYIIIGLNGGPKTIKETLLCKGMDFGVEE